MAKKNRLDNKKPTDVLEVVDPLEIEPPEKSPYERTMTLLGKYAYLSCGIDTPYPTVSAIDNQNDLDKYRKYKGLYKYKINNKVNKESFTTQEYHRWYATECREQYDTYFEEFLEKMNIFLGRTKDDDNYYELPDFAKSKNDNKKGEEIDKEDGVKSNKKYIENKEKLIKKFTKNILNNLPFLFKYKNLEDKLKAFQVKSNEADEYIGEIIKEYFPQYTESLYPLNDVVTRYNPGELLFEMLNSDNTDRNSYESRRKLFLTLKLGEMEYSSSDRDSLSYMLDLLNNEIYFIPEGKKIGYVDERYIISTENSETGEVLSVKKLSDMPLEKKKKKKKKKKKIVNSPSGEVKTISRITPINTRIAKVFNPTEGEKVIDIIVETRRKKVRDILTKDFRIKGKDIYDQNGVKIILESVDDWNDFFSTLKKKLKETIKDRLDIALKNPDNKESDIQKKINEIESSISIYKHKKNLDGTAEFDATDKKSSSDKLKIEKFRLKINNLDKKYTYEFQIFLLSGYIESLYREGVAWPIYNIKRFYNADIPQLLFPSLIYNIDLDEAKKEAYKKAESKRLEPDKGEN